MGATVNDHLSIQVTKYQHYALQRTTAALVYTGASLGHVHTAHACTTAATQAGVKAAAKVGVKVAAKGGARGGARAGANAAADSAVSGAESLFQLGFRAALSGTAIGIVAGVAVAVNLLIEGPLLAISVYKLYRKKKFDQLSQEEYYRGLVQESITSANTVVGAVGGAIVGQVAIPVPVLGAAVGGAVGGIVGQACGRAEGWAASKAVRDPRPVTLPQLTETSFVDNPPPLDEKKKKLNRCNIYIQTVYSYRNSLFEGIYFCAPQLNSMNFSSRRYSTRNQLLPICDFS